MTIGIRTAESNVIPSGGVTYPKAQGFGALIDDLFVRLAPDMQQPVRIYTKDSLAERLDQKGSVYENVLDIGYAWARGSAVGGEGLDWDPRLVVGEQAPLADDIRYWDSNNLDVRRAPQGELERITLSKSIESWRNQAGLVDLATSDRYLFIGYSSTVEWWVDWDAPGATGSATTAAPIQRIEASPHGDVVALVDGGTLEYMEDGSGTFVAVPGLVDVQQHWYAKGRFIAYIDDPATSGSLVEFDENGVIGSAFDTFKAVCYSVVSSGPAIVGVFSDGTIRSYVPEQSNQAQADSVNIVRRAVQDAPEGEEPYLLGSNAGTLLFLTRTTQDNSLSPTIRLYQAEVLDARFDYVVGQIQLRREWAQTDEVPDPRKNMSGTRDEIWWVIEESPGVESIWRYDLVTTGISRHSTVTSPQVYSFVAFDDRLGYVSGIDIWRSTDNFVDEGWMISPNITFGLNTAINWIALVASAQNLQSSGKQVEVWYSLDAEAILDEAHLSWKLGLRISSEVQSDQEAFLAKVQSRQIALMLRIYSTVSGTQTPAVSNWAIRGIPAHRDWILELPVNVSDIIEAPGRRPIRIPGYGDTIHAALMSREGDSLEIQILDPPFGFRGIIDNILEPTEYISARGGVSIRCVLQCRGSRVTAVANPTGDAGLGLGLLGVATLGIGQTDRT